MIRKYEGDNISFKLKDDNGVKVFRRMILDIVSGNCAIEQQDPRILIPKRKNSSFSIGFFSVPTERRN